MRFHGKVVNWYGKDFANAPLHGIVVDDKQVLIAQLGDKFFAMGNVCTHNGCRISGGKPEGETVRCPCHGSEFCIGTGAVVHGPAKDPEPVFSTTVENGEIFIEL